MCQGDWWAGQLSSDRLDGGKEKGAGGRQVPPHSRRPDLGPQVLAYACVYSFYNQETEQMDVVEQQTENLELHTNALQILLGEACPLPAQSSLLPIPPEHPTPASHLHAVPSSFLIHGPITTGLLKFCWKGIQYRL